MFYDCLLFVDGFLTAHLSLIQISEEPCDIDTFPKTSKQTINPHNDKLNPLHQSVTGVKTNAKDGLHMQPVLKND